MVPSLRRALALGGIAAAGWLLGGAGSAIADQLPGEATAVVEGLHHGVVSDLADLRPAADGAAAPAAGSGASAEEAAPRKPSARPLDLSTSGTAARNLLDGTAHGAGEIVSGTVRAGQAAGAYADRTLVSDGARLGRVSSGLTGPATGIAHGLHGVIDDAPRPGPLTALVPEQLAGIPGALAPTGATSTGGGVAGAADPDDPSDRKGPDPAEPSAATAADARAGSVDGGLVAAGLAQVDGARAAGQPGQDAGDREPVDPSWPHHGSESAGAVSGSSVHTPAAGFLAHRADMLSPSSQRLAVPGDAHTVVRDSADDPSFSPD
ncbi:hypothetical protein [Marinactinospora rubrisoli]|uniref:ATP-binding protein n=1 Tax=Marinactinospora rubrisoli TaxID=2715399 RepID=A0ABW2KJB5_9ACTN